jgi:hypothetical protein
MLGYCVRPGEKALKIFAPCPPSKVKLQVWRDAGADPAEKPPTYFRLTAVFERTQVDELPPPAEPAPLDPPAAPEIEGDELGSWLEPLTALAAEVGSSVSFEPISGGVDGFYRPSTKAIVVEAAHSTNRRVKTLIHELSRASAPTARTTTWDSTAPPRSWSPRPPRTASGPPAASIPATTRSPISRAGANALRVRRSNAPRQSGPAATSSA